LTRQVHGLVDDRPQSFARAARCSAWDSVGYVWHSQSRCVVVVRTLPSVRLTSPIAIAEGSDIMRACQHLHRPRAAEC
jgi:hypothetical protein